jgi:hypothetical protein
MCPLGSHKIRRMDYYYASSPTKSTASAGSGTTEDGPRGIPRCVESHREEEQQELADMVLQLALSFFIKVGQHSFCFAQINMVCVSFAKISTCLDFFGGSICIRIPTMVLSKVLMNRTLSWKWGTLQGCVCKHSRGPRACQSCKGPNMLLGLMTL